MRILADRSNRRLLVRLLVWGCLGAAVAALAAARCGAWAAPAVAAVCLAVTALLAAELYRHLRAQDRLFEEAVAQIRAYMAGDAAARIPCEEEGELYRLFHEVNALAAILQAHAEQEGAARVFLKDTLSNISHQLKTPLAALNIYNGLLQQESGDLPAVRRFADLSEQELDRMQALVQNLLKIARLDAGTIVLEKTVENLAELMDCIRRHFAYQAKQQGKTLLFCGDDTVTLACDRTWLLEAVSNLVKNAFDHTRAGDTIRIEWKGFAAIVQITVQDTGSGIHPEDLPHIFKRFYRSRFSGDTQGVGLGLPLAKAIVEAHGGTIQVDSEPGRGALFTLRFLIPTKL